MKKPLLLVAVIGTASLTTLGQTISQKLELTKKSSKTKENAAKADAFIVNKRIIVSDSTKILKPLAIKRKKSTKKSLK